MDGDRGELVVVESAPRVEPVVEFEPQGFDQMEACTRVRSQPDDRPGVRSDLGMDEHDLHEGVNSA